MQLDLSSWMLDQARIARDTALEQVEHNAEPEWKDEAWAWLVRYLEQHPTFFPDDVWAAGCPEPREARAFGPLVLKASKQGLIVKTSERRQRTRGNCAEAGVWASKIYKGAR